MKRRFVIIASIILALTLSACGRGTEDVTTLSRVRDASHLRALLNESEGWNTDGFFAVRDGLAEVHEDDDASRDTREHSDTNVQVDGVDEGDIVKTDGNRIYALRFNALTVIDIDQDGSMTIVFDEARDDDVWGHYRELYITDTKLVVVGVFYDVTHMPYGGRSEDDADVYYFPVYHTMTTVDVYDKHTMELEDAFQMSGHLMGSRLIGDNLYLIGSHDAYRDQDDPRPYFYVNDSRIMPDYSDITYLPHVPTRSFTVISTIRLADDNELEYDIFLGATAWGQLYVSEEGIYLASTRYEVVSTRRINDTAVSDSFEMRGTIVSYVFDENGSVEYGGAGDFKGFVINQFAMDEHDGYFRLVTRDGWGESAINRLYVFERVYEDGEPRLEQRALLDEGIGKPEETVRSVRFDGDIVTVVTFEEIDPFYVIDLSDPLNPTILGELEMPGFSTYQHPWKNDTVIGVGYETNENGWVIGLKLSLIDISDYENPVEIGEPLVLLNETQGWQYGEALHNHKAILVSEAFDFIAFAISRATWGETYEYHSDYLVFDIDLERDQPIQIAASISHMERFGEEGEWPWPYTFNVNRAVTINNQLYVISNGAITRHDINDDFSEIDHIEFDKD